MRNRWKYRRLFTGALKISDLLVTLAGSYIDELDEMGVKRKGDILAISNPVSFDKVEISNRQKEPRLVFVGRLSKGQKRVDRLMEVIKQLHASCARLSFDIAGDGPDRGWMEDYKRDNSLNRVSFHGFVDPRNLLEKSCILVLTSDFEGFPMVLTEAQSYGVIPVITPCFSAASFVLGNGGIVVKDFKVNTMANEIMALLESKEMIDYYSNKCLDNVRRFKPGDIALEWIQAINSLN